MNDWPSNFWGVGVSRERLEGREEGEGIRHWGRGVVHVPRYSFILLAGFEVVIMYSIGPYSGRESYGVSSMKIRFFN